MIVREYKNFVKKKRNRYFLSRTTTVSRDSVPQIISKTVGFAITQSHPSNLFPP